jgi:LPS-assembly lipoprotein
MVLALTALAALSGCGFAPALGEGGKAQVLVGKVQATAPANQRDYDFAARIEERLGRPDTALYSLTYQIGAASYGAGITASGAITHYRVTGSADWALTRDGDGAQLASGREESFTGYSVTGSTVAGLTAEADAERRLMRILADQVVAAMLAQSTGFQP